jgi:hypothetical protein
MFPQTAVSCQRLLEQYSRGKFPQGQGRVLRIGYGGDVATAKMAQQFDEVHCLDFTAEHRMAAALHAANYGNVFIHGSDRSDLREFQDGQFQLTDIAPAPWFADREWMFDGMRAASRVLQPGGFMRMRVAASLLSLQEATDATRFLQLQALAFDAPDRNGFQELLWRRQEMNWREELPTLASITSVKVRKITNTLRAIPVAPARGKYTSVCIFIEGLPEQVDLFDLSVRLSGSSAKILALGPPDAKDIRCVWVQLPELEQTGLIPVELFWMEERMGVPGVLRVVPPPPIIPRLVGVCTAPDGIVTAILEDLLDPEIFEAKVEGKPAWGYENRCVDGSLQRYEIRFQLPDEIQPGYRELSLRLGKRELPPIRIEVAAPPSPYAEEAEALPELVSFAS